MTSGLVVAFLCSFVAFLYSFISIWFVKKDVSLFELMNFNILSKKVTLGYKQIQKDEYVLTVLLENLFD